MTLDEVAEPPIAGVAMKAHKIPDVHSSHPNVTPLIDVVMCLIIFYMLVAKIGVNRGLDQKLALPMSVQGIKLTDLGNTVTLNVSPGVRADSEPVVTTLNPDNGQIIPFRLTEGAKHPLADFLKLARGKNNEFKVIIRADQTLDYHFLEPVLMVCAEAAVKNVNFATREPQAVRSVR